MIGFGRAFANILGRLTVQRFQRAAHADCVRSVFSTNGLCA
jgi:hypothetical protein